MQKLFPMLFLVSLVAYIALATVEEFIPGFVSDYFNPHWLFVLVIITLIAMLVFEKPPRLSQAQSYDEHGEGAKPTCVSDSPKGMRFFRKGAGLIFLSGIATLLILWFGAHEISTFWRVLVALYGGLIVIGILSVLFKD